jgi:hypothetical protein
MYLANPSNIKSRYLHSFMRFLGASFLWPSAAEFQVLRLEIENFCGAMVFAMGRPR